MDYLNNRGPRQYLYEKICQIIEPSLDEINLDQDRGQNLAVFFKNYFQIVKKLTTKNITNWYQFFSANDNNRFYNIIVDATAVVIDNLVLSEFVSHAFEDYELVKSELFLIEKYNLTLDQILSANNAIMLTNGYLDTITEALLDYMVSVFQITINTGILYENLTLKKPQLSQNVEWFDIDMLPQENDKTGDWFYNTRDMDSNQEVIRVYTKKLLDKIPKKDGKMKNPFTREDWNSNVLARFSVTKNSNDDKLQKGGKTYHVKNNKKYLVRIGPKGGKYIMIKNEKIRV